MPTLTVLWERLVLRGDGQDAESGATCERCGLTGAAMREAVQLLRETYAGQNVEVELVERALSPFELDRSNRVLMNGEPVETLLGAEVGASPCPSCCDMLGTAVECRTLLLDGQAYEALPADMLLRAGRIALEKHQLRTRTEETRP